MISVVVRCHNDAWILRRTLDGVFAQRGVEFEVLGFDDDSTDGSAEIFAEYPVRLFRSGGTPYNPARVLNRAVAEARGDIVLFNNSDAVPLDPDCFAKLTAPLADPEVGVAFGNQLCRSDARLLVRKDYLRAFGDGKEAATWRFFFSLVSSAARRELLLAEPFDPEMTYSEDIEWAWRIRRKLGLRIVYVPEARVEHSHNYPLSGVWKRFYQEGRAEARIFGGALPLPTAARQLTMEILRDLRFEWKERAFREILPGLVYRITQKYACWRGARDFVREGRP